MRPHKTARTDPASCQPSLHSGARRWRSFHLGESGEQASYVSAATPRNGFVASWASPILRQPSHVIAHPHVGADSCSVRNSARATSANGVPVELQLFKRASGPTR